MRRSTLKIAGYLLLVFASGLAVGAFGSRFVNIPPVVAKSARPSPEEWRKQYLSEMQSRLKLSPDQFQHLNQILDDTQSRFHEARAAHNQVMKSIKQEQIVKIRGMLTDAQRGEYEKLHAEREQRAKALSGK